MSSVELLNEAVRAGYRTTPHIVAVPVELSVVRVKIRHVLGGHDVPEAKIGERYDRLWGLLARSILIVDEAFLSDNSGEGTGFPLVAQWGSGVLIGEPSWPRWMPEEMCTAGR
jgi:predicted ABC-type ATPase